MQVPDFTYLDWDQWDLDHVAEVLHHTHKGYAERGFDSPAKIAEHIRYTAENIFFHGRDPVRPTWVGTGGWYVLFCPISYATDGRWKALPFLQTFHVHRALGLDKPAEPEIEYLTPVSGS